MRWSNLLVISHLALWVVVLAQAALLVALARLVGQLMGRRFPAAGARVIDPGPEIGTRVDDWEGADLFGRGVCFQFPRERGLFLLSMSPHCSVCAALLPSAKRFLKEIDREAEGVWVLVMGSEQAQARYAEQNGLTSQAVLSEDRLPAGWRVGGTPFGLWVDGSGEVRAKGMVNNREQLESLRHAAGLGHPSLQSYVAARAEEAERRREQGDLMGSR
jgi:methylamine dehydrogenase accessory protein MauD